MWLVDAYVSVMIVLHPISVPGGPSCFKRDPSSCVVGKELSDWRGQLASTRLCARRSNKECAAIDAYIGTQSVTAKGVICAKWNEVTTHTFTDNHNFCRNPEGHHMPYCYTKNINNGVYKSRTCFEKCDINYYEECGYAARLQNTIIPVPDLYNCTYMLGRGHFGQVLSNITGNPEDCCQKCRITNNCTGYTWLKRTCVLYSRIDENRHIAEAISGESCKDNQVQDFRRQKPIDNSGDCTYLPGIEIEDSTGDNIFGTPSTISVGSCCRTCIQSSSCLGYTWTNGMCHLKTSIKKYKRTTGNVYISGEVCVKNRPGSGTETHTNLASAIDTTSNTNSSEEGDHPGKDLTLLLISLLLLVLILVLIAVFRRPYIYRKNKRETSPKSLCSETESLGSPSNKREEGDGESMTRVNLGRLNHEDDESVTEGSQFKSEGEKAIQSSSTKTAISPNPEFESQYMVQEITLYDPNREMMSIVKERELYGVEEGLEVPSSGSSGSTVSSNSKTGSSSASSI